MESALRGGVLRLPVGFVQSFLDRGDVCLDAVEAGAEPVFHAVET